MPDMPIPIKMNLAIYRLGRVLTLEIRIKSGRRSFLKLLVPFPMVWCARVNR
jgi:hypothetical protein